MSTEGHPVEASAPTTGPVRTEIGRYQVLRPLASGGMAAVVLARVAGQPGFERFVAIKRPHPHLALNPTVVKMFESEARLVAQLDHENICPLVDFGADADGPFLVMPFLFGEPLSTLMNRFAHDKHRIPLDWMAYVAAAVLDGLHYAHNATDSSGRALGLVHRDVSPHNVFLTYDGAVKILDFGVAKAMGVDGFSQTGQLKGKYAYMSPEHVAGAPLDQRADLFSLGIVLWESLAGRRLFKRHNDMATLLAIGECAVPPLSTVNGEVKPELQAIVMRALSKAPADRYQSAREMGRDLRRWLSSQGSVLCPTEVALLMRALFPDHAGLRDPLTARISYPAGRNPQASQSMPDLPAPEAAAAVDDTPTARLLEKNLTGRSIEPDGPDAPVTMAGLPIEPGPLDNSAEQAAMLPTTLGGPEAAPTTPIRPVSSPARQPISSEVDRSPTERFPEEEPADRTVESLGAAVIEEKTTIQPDTLVAPPAPPPPPLPRAPRISRSEPVAAGEAEPRVSVVPVSRSEPLKLSAPMPELIALGASKSAPIAAPADKVRSGPSRPAPPPVTSPVPVVSATHPAQAARTERQLMLLTLLGAGMLAITAVLVARPFEHAPAPGPVSPRAIVISPESGSSTVSLAARTESIRRFLEAGDLDQARAALDRCLAASDHPPCHKAMGILLARSKDAAGARAHYQRYLELVPAAADRARVEHAIKDPSFEP